MALSHAMEQAALAAAEDGPMVVIALFQRKPYFARERAVYERIARVAAVTLIGLVAEDAPSLPDGVSLVLLDDKEELAREWTVVVLTPRWGSVLVAHDREEVEAGAATMESGRIFSARWSYRRDDALHEALRLRRVLADRLPVAAGTGMDRVIERLREIPPAPGEARGDAALRLLVNNAERDHALLRAARLHPETGSHSPAVAALESDESLRRWSGTSGVTASGVLPVAMFAVRVEHQGNTVQPVGRTHARRDEAVIAVLSAHLLPADRLTRIGENEYLRICPGISRDDAVAHAYKIGADFAAAAQRSAFLSVVVTVAMSVTRIRPLPVESLRAALQWAVGQGIPVATIDN